MNSKHKTLTASNFVDRTDTDKTNNAKTSHATGNEKPELMRMRKPRQKGRAIASI
jgi:hypothetical protein